MVRRRAAESVAATEEGIEEVVIRHRQTRSGVWTTQHVVPVLIPVKEKVARSSRSRKVKKGQEDTQFGGQSTLSDLQIDDLQIPQYIDEEAADEHLDTNTAQEKVKKPSVRITSHSHKVI